MAEASHRIVFELSSGEPEVWSTVLRNVENVRGALGPASTRVVVVAHGSGLRAYLAEAELGDALRALQAAGVEFDACANTLRRTGLAAAALPDGVRVVDSGVAEIVRRQEQGFAYVKGG